MSEGQKLLLAVANDDVKQFIELRIPSERLITMTFEENMNVLNLALDQFQKNILQLLAITLSKEEKKHLVEHEFLGITAVH